MFLCLPFRDNDVVSALVCILIFTWKHRNSKTEYLGVFCYASAHYRCAQIMLSGHNGHIGHISIKRRVFLNVNGYILFEWIGFISPHLSFQDYCKCLGYAVVQYLEEVVISIN